MTQPGSKAKKMKAPELVFEKEPGERALVEAKGGFVGEDHLANIKGELAEGLDQLAPWGEQFSPAIKKKYAIGAFLREAGDGHNEESLIALVDPEGREENNASEVPPWAIRRANYAAWLRGMGYLSASQRVSIGGDTRRQRFLVRGDGGRAETTKDDLLGQIVLRVPSADGDHRDPGACRGELGDGLGATSRVEATGVGDHLDALGAAVGEHVTHLRDESARIPGTALHRRATQDRHGQFGKPVAGEYVDGSAVDHLSCRGQAIAIET